MGQATHPDDMFDVGLPEATYLVLVVATAGVLL
jgi:hypothetical protein